MGWTAFLLHSFALGLDSLFTAQVCTWAGKPFYCIGLHMGCKAFLLHRFAHGLGSLLTAQVCTWAGKPFYRTGLHMGWKAFLQHRFTHGKFGSLSNYCFVPAMPMEPPTKKRRYLKGMELAEADREQYQGWELDNSQDSQVLLEPEGGPPEETTLEQMRAERTPEHGNGVSN